MSIVLVCPTCKAANTFHRVPIEGCPSCESPFPDDLRRTAELGLAASAAQRPLLITIGAYGSLLVGGIFLLFLVLAPFDVGTYSIYDRPVSGPEFLRIAGVFFAVCCAICLAIAYGIWRGRSWTRPLMLAFWSVVGLELIGRAAFETPVNVSSLLWDILWTLLYLLGSALYLYGRRNVVEYYRALERVEGAHG